MKKVVNAMKDHVSFSFEVFPPKADRPVEPLFATIDKLCGFRPDFISCTYGAGGTNAGRHSEILDYIANHTETAPVAHYTCIGTRKADVLELVERYRAFGCSSFLALRGDYPKGSTCTGGDFDFGYQLVAFLRENFPDLEIAAAYYPEKHPQTPDDETEIAIMKAKQDAGADFFMTQLCHDIDGYARFTENVRAAGITLPIDFGLMPVLSKDATIRMALSNGSSIPRKLSEIISRYGDDPEDFRKAGKEYTVEQLLRLYREDVQGIHIFALNKYDDVADIIRMSGIGR